MNGARPLVSVVASARGNAAALQGLLAVLACQSLDPAEVEVIAVDNDPPAEGLSAAATAVAGQWPFPVRCVAEPRPGLSVGRNRGIREAAGRYVAITDPDIIPDQGWLAALVTAAEEEKAFAVGGRTDVTYPGGQAFPLPRALAECHGPVEWPGRRVPLEWPWWATGCNLLLARQEAIGLGLFRTDLGRRGRWLGDCEDLELIDRARQRGLGVVLEPAARAAHPVGRRETTAWYLARQGAGHGTCVARMHQSVHVEPAAIRAGLRHGAAATADLAAGCLTGDAGRAVTGLRDLARIGSYHAERARLLVLRPIPALSPSPVTLEGEHQ